MPEAESKLVEKYENATKFSEEELKQVKEIQDGYFDVQSRLGQVAVAKIRLEKQFNELEEHENNLHKRFNELQETERKFLDSVTEKYGQGTLNPDTGEFIPNK